MKKKLFVLSMDAMVGEDIEYLRNKPNFSKIMAHCCQIEKVQTVYPSITYPAHCSMITGCKPGRHGIYNNTVFMSKVGYPDWYIDRTNIKVEDLFDAAKRAGCTTGSVYWPIMGNNKNIDYNVNEYFFYKERKAQKIELNEDIVVKDFVEMGANEDTVKVIKENYKRFPTQYDNRVGDLAINQTFDDFINGCICSIIRRYQPDLLVAHNCFLDSSRHKYGIFNEHINHGLDIMDEWLGEIADAMKEAGVYDDTNFVIISDHGQMDFMRRVKPNVLLVKEGFLNIDENGKPMDDWRAYVQSNGMSASVHVKDKKDEKAVYELFRKYCDGEIEWYGKNWGIGEVLTKAQVEEKYGWSGPFSFVLETDGYTTFSEECKDPFIGNVDFEDYRLGKATHGYQPEKGPQPVFVAKGPDFKKDFKIPFAYTIDEAPTFAKILGDGMPTADGRVLDEILA